MERLLQLWEEEMEKVKQAGIQVGLLKGIEEGELRERINIAHAMIQAGENERKIKNTWFL